MKMTPTFHVINQSMHPALVLNMFLQLHLNPDSGEKTSLKSNVYSENGTKGTNIITFGYDCGKRLDC